MTYRYETSICIFTIARLGNGDFGVFVNDDNTCYNGSSDIYALIDDINTGHTGFDPWDDEQYLDEEVPMDLEEWEHLD